MPVYSRKVKNKRLPDGTFSGRAGTVYDVFFKYSSNGEQLSYGKRGFLDRASANEHEAQMRLRLTTTTYSKDAAKVGKEPFSDYLLGWLESYAKTNVRPSTCKSYEDNINKHIIPELGRTPLNKVTAPMLDSLFSKMKEQGYAQNTILSVYRTLSVSLNHAVSYQYISINPVQNTVTRFKDKVKTPDPYTIPQVRKLMQEVEDTNWEFMIMLAALYGLRRNEILGLQDHCINLEENYFKIEYQLANRATKKKTGAILADLKEDPSERTLPITPYTKPYFEKQFQRRDLVLLNTKSDFPHFMILTDKGTPYTEEHISDHFKKIAGRLSLPAIRFHDLRHTAATNMHLLTGDFYTVAAVLGHSLRGIGGQLRISGNLEATTERYIDVQLESLRRVLNTYHRSITNTENKKHL